jgi:hypothetical protein
MSEISKIINQLLWTLTVIFVVIMVIGCASNNYKAAQLAEADAETLRDLWVYADSYSNRFKIVQEFEMRKSVDDLGFLLDWITNDYSIKSKWFSTRSKFTIKEAIEIVNALGRIKNPQAIKMLSRTFHRIQDKDYKLAVLVAYQQIGYHKAALAIMDSITDSDPDVRYRVLEALGHIKTTDSMEAVLPLLLDDDPQIRWKAVITLGEIGNPKAAQHIAFLLDDPENLVRTTAKAVLKDLGISDEKIADWTKKARQISLDEVYRTKLAYQRAEFEKQELEKQLENEKDLKKQLQESLKNQETVSGRQMDLIESLYEKERQLKSKQAQLDITRQQTEDYQRELERLNAKVKSLNAELKKAKSQVVSDNVKEELDKTLEAKTKLEKESKKSKKKESLLSEEIVSLTALAERTRMEAEAAKKEISELRNREKQLTNQVDELKQRLNRSMAPVLVVSKPQNGVKIESPNTLLHFIAVDDKGISSLNVSLNGNPLTLDHVRGLKIVATGVGSNSKKIDVSHKLHLQYGQNVIEITATDIDGISQIEIIKIYRVKERGHMWAIIIGINQYQKAQNLKYAVNDAQAFRGYLKDYVGIPDERIFYLANQDATKTRIESLLGTTIKRKASKDDTVIIFYAGHGAVEPDQSNLDGDGFEKYLLPHDADVEDLYSTSISMNNLRTIFMRIRSDRLIFIADTCYSGASGGRTMMATKTRANLSDTFYDRISKGKGRVIISSCSANEVSKEDDSLQHGIFSYYMLEGLKGRADQDKDGIITISELFSYISRKVPEASAQDQHPVKKGETQGELVIGRTK